MVDLLVQSDGPTKADRNRSEGSPSRTRQMDIWYLGILRRLTERNLWKKSFSLSSMAPFRDGVPSFYSYTQLEIRQNSVKERIGIGLFKFRFILTPVSVHGLLLQLSIYILI